MKGIILRDFEVRRLASAGSVLIWRRAKCAANSIHMGRLLGTWGLSVPPFQWDGNKDDLYNWTGAKLPSVGDWIEIFQTDVDDHASAPITCPHGRTGETRFVKETFALPPGESCKVKTERATGGVSYFADNDQDCGRIKLSSIHMPSWASRFRVTLSVSCRQIQSVTEEEAIAGGCDEAHLEHTEDCESEHCALAGGVDDCCGYLISSRLHLKSLIESRNPGSWNLNSWFWAIDAKEVK